VHFDTVGALGGASDSYGDEFTILLRNGAGFAPNDVLQTKPSVEIRGRKLAHVFEESKVCRVMIVQAHSYILPDWWRQTLKYRSEKEFYSSEGLASTWERKPAGRLPLAACGSKRATRKFMVWILPTAFAIHPETEEEEGA
jgi:hypothetical protein